MKTGQTVAMLLALTLLASPRASAQSCTTASSSKIASRKCTVALNLGNWTVNKTGTVTLSSVADIAIPTPDGTTYNTTKAEASSLGRTATVMANAAWTLTAAPNSASSCVWGTCWTGADAASPNFFVHAETDKPTHEFLIGTAFSASASGYIALPDANTPSGSATLASGSATTNPVVVNLYWAEMWWYANDTPGTYTLPFVITLTLP